MPWRLRSASRCSVAFTPVSAISSAVSSSSYSASSIRVPVQVRLFVAIAVSMAILANSWDQFAPYAQRTADVVAASLISELRARGFPKDYYLNVNYPARPLEKVKGVRIVRQDTRQALDYYEKRTNPLGSIYFYPLYDLLDAGKEETDIWALKNGFVSVTPMSVDQSIQPPVAGLEFLRKLTWNSR